MKEIDEIKYKMIYEQYFRLMFSIAYQYINNVMDAEDIVQDAFNKFFTSKHKLDSDDHIRNSLCKITVHLSIDCIRKKKKIIISEENDLEDKTKDGENYLLHKAIENLKEPYKQIILLYYYNNISIKDIAKIQKTTVSNVKTRLSRAREELRKELEEND